MVMTCNSASYNLVCLFLFLYVLIHVHAIHINNKSLNQVESSQTCVFLQPEELILYDRKESVKCM